MLMDNIMKVLTVVLATAYAAGSVARSPQADLLRAQQRVPRAPWRGNDFADMSRKLTDALRRSGNQVAPCESWTTLDLKHLLRRIFKLSKAELLGIYDAANDNRRQRFATLSALESHWETLDAAAQMARLEHVRRDGLCHELVMWWAHHLSSTSQKLLTTENITLPSLPQQRHRAKASTVETAKSDAESVVFDEYEQQVSCQQCHTGNISNPDWQDASMSPPLSVDKLHPGQERLRSCDFQNQPPCGPCEGLGGRRWGDGPEEMEAMQCEVLSGPEKAATTRGMYPQVGRTELTGDTRWPLSGHHDTPGHYKKINGTLFLGWTDHLMRMRYDFAGFGSQVSAQSFEQARNHDVGATIGISPQGCTCDASIAGNMHIHAFEASDPLDPLKLQPELGGAAYLGRILVTLDGDTSLSKRTAVADHYLKWAFHFLVDANASSPNFGLPLRLYASWGVRQVFEPWNLSDPVEAKTDVWKLPPNCTVKASACSIFETSIHASEMLV